MKNCRSIMYMPLSNVSAVCVYAYVMNGIELNIMPFKFDSVLFIPFFRLLSQWSLVVFHWFRYAYKINEKLFPICNRCNQNKSIFRLNRRSGTTQTKGFRWNTIHLSTNRIDYVNNVRDWFLYRFQPFNRHSSFTFSINKLRIVLPLRTLSIYSDLSWWQSCNQKQNQ